MRHLALSPIVTAALAALVMALPAGGAAARESEERPGGGPGQGREQHGPPGQDRGRGNAPPGSWEREAERRVVPRERPEPRHEQGGNPGGERRDDRDGRDFPPGRGHWDERGGRDFPPGGGHWEPRGGRHEGWRRDDDGPRPHWEPAPQWQGTRPALPPHGHAVRRLPPRHHAAVHAGQRYWFADGVWYAPRGSDYVVIRPPVGIVVAELPVFRTIVRIGAVTLYFVNDVYYRPLSAGGYQVVAPPAGTPVWNSTLPQPMVYPRQGQSPQRQARDEYECHGWAASRSGYDPTQGAPAWERQWDDYRRAQAACLEGRGYTVR